MTRDEAARIAEEVKASIPTLVQSMTEGRDDLPRYAMRGLDSISDLVFWYLTETFGKFE